MSEKIQARHLARPAILYVRQSTAHQVQHNEESQRLQYAMADRLRALGWRDVQTIDEDLGKSASGKTERSGFQRLVSEVSLGKVGAICARELSRFARNNMDWQKLMEVCRYVDTLLIDHDAVYDIRHGNDRLLLGMKGNLNEYELDLLRLRAHEARTAKARRGEYYAKIAVGYRKTDDGLEKNPDARVQHAVRLVFDKMLELGSARQVLLWLREQSLQVPVNRSGSGDVRWKQPSASWVYMVLTNPIYGGSYAYGRSTFITTVDEHGALRRSQKRNALANASVLLHDRHDGYITRDVFERIQMMLSKNSQVHGRPGPGAARVGEAMLAGLLRCRRCGEKLVVTYGGTSHRVHRYECCRGHRDRGDARCIGFGGLDLDARIGELVLRVVAPAAVEATMKLANEGSSQNDAAVDALRLELKGARYAAERAERQYDTVEPENRLVADELERRWNVALERVSQLEARIDAILSAAPSAVAEPARFAKLGSDLAQVWNAPTTDIRLKKRIVRTLIEEIVVDTTEAELCAVVHWKGGVHTEVSIPRRRRGQNRAHTAPETTDAVRFLARVCSDEQIARALNASELKTARGNLWTVSLVRSFRGTHTIAVYTSRPDPEWLNLNQSAKLAGVSEVTLRLAIERGVISALRPVSGGPWILERAELMKPNVLASLTKKPRRRPGDPAAPTTTQLNLMIPRT